MSDAVRASPRVRMQRMWHDIVEFFRVLTQRSPARFAILIYLLLILTFTGLFSLPIAASDPDGAPRR